MTETDHRDPLRGYSDQELAWMGAHLPELRRTLFGERLLYEGLIAGFVLGLVAHIVGFYLGTGASTGLIQLIADLMYALGLALWTGCVLVVFTQVYPAAKRRQIKRALDQYEAVRRGKDEPV
ncbi:MAG TPA: hypothetical protein VEX62_09175 [Candidatus Limnocylindrales bacterium]|nr:hypothetical protein [Candidatus Limnocylindrales bacterium]